MMSAKVVAPKLKGSKEMSMVNMCCCIRKMSLLDRIEKGDDQWIEFDVNGRCELRCFEVEIYSD